MMAQRTAKLIFPKPVATRSLATCPEQAPEMAGPGEGPDEDGAVLRWLETDPTAAENEGRLLKVLAQHRENPPILAAMVRCSRLPLAVSDRLLPLLPPGLAREMRARHPLSPNAASAPEKLGRERPDWWQQDMHRLFR